jgi:uncharacterized membrane protein
MNWKLVVQLSLFGLAMAIATVFVVPVSPRVMMAITGPLVGVISGIVLGLFALIAVKIMNRTARPAAA